MRQLDESSVKAVDLDGTLADSSVIDMNGYDPEVIGPPIPRMVERVRAWLAQGKKVVIFTARVHPGHGPEEAAAAVNAIKDWCVENVGLELEVTCMKDPSFEEIWDDKAVRVQENTGCISSQEDVVDCPFDEPDQIGQFFG